MITANKRARLLSTTMITGVALAAVSGVYAQEAPATAAGSVAEVVVTGSRIPTPNLTSASPVTVVTSQEFKLEGTTNVETLLNSLPQVSPDMGLTSDNGTVGAANVDLRSLGAKRTLVLVDGKRLQPGDPLIPVPDLDNIPAALVDRVDVLTGGASAVYGSDAVAGVVNFIMKKNFEGVRLDAQYGIYNYNNDDTGNVRAAFAQNLGGSATGLPTTGFPTGSVWDGATWDVTAMIGANAPDGKGNITAFAEYRHVDAISQAARDYSYCELGTVGFTNSADVYNNHLCFGSSNNAYGRFEPQTGPSVGQSLSNNPNGTQTFVPFTAALDYNFAPSQYLLSDNERYSAGYFAHYEINKMVEVYSDFMFSSNETKGQLGPSGLFLGPLYNINCNNPLMSASQATALCGANAGTAALVSSAIGYRFSDVGGASLPRDYDYLHESYKIDIGIRGDLGGGWSYDTYAQYGYSRFNEYVAGQFSTQAIQNALEVNPNGTCYVGGSCVPLNIFEVGGVTPAAAKYLSAPGVEQGYAQEQIVEADLIGDLGHYGIKSPLAKDGVGVALGVDYRGEKLGLQVDSLTASGDISGSGGPTNPVPGAGYNVKEAYGEIRVPLAQDLPFVKNLEVDGGYRYSSYSTAGGTNTYKVTGLWSVTQDIMLRAGYNRAVRAPNIVELFTPQSPSLFSGSDPCAGKVIPTTSAQYAGCLASGATAAQLAAGSIPQCPAGQCVSVTGGNPNLKPETADTYTVGGVLTPRWVPGLSISLDYFKITVTNVIEGGLGGPVEELANCVNTSNPLYCNLIHRDPIAGSLFISSATGPTTGVYAVNVNAGQLETSGFDFQINYRLKFSDFFSLPDWGSLTFRYDATYTEHLINTPIAGGGNYDCVGSYGAVCGTPTPYLKSKLRVTYSPSQLPLTISLQWRYLGGVNLDLNSSNPLLGVDGYLPDTVPGEAHIPAYNYFDLAATWRLKDKYTFRVGVNNIFAVEPPVLDTGYLGISILPFGNGNTYPNVYDSLGRQIFVGVTADF